MSVNDKYLWHEVLDTAPKQYTWGDKQPGKDLGPTSQWYTEPTSPIKNTVDGAGLLKCRFLGPTDLNEGFEEHWVGFEILRFQSASDDS